MYVVWAWFAERPMAPGSSDAMRARFEASIAELVPESFVRHDAGGDDWGVTVLRPGQKPLTRWEMVATADRLTAVSLGIPAGVSPQETPISLARRMLAGAEIQRDLVPPFGLLAVDGDETFAAQQDWLGQCRLFSAESDGVTVFCTRPSMAAHTLFGSVAPDLDAWASYAITTHFGGDMSPIRGVRLLKPGERVTGRRATGGGWSLTSEIGYNVDNIVTDGLAGRGITAEVALREAAEHLTATAVQVDDLYDGVTMGLSGGKDSRLLAASLVAAGRPPSFYTQEDIRAEGETARKLVAILREQRGLTIEHDVRLAAAPRDVFEFGLRDRVMRMQRRYDFQFPYTYATRPAEPELLPDTVFKASISGAGGELATAYWHARPDEPVVAPEITAVDRLLRGVAGVDAAAVEKERGRAWAVVRQGLDIGVRGQALTDYVYLVERVRRWYSSAYTVGQVTSYLSPPLVALTFALSDQQKRDMLLHTGLTELLVPEWAGIPFVQEGLDNSTVPAVWEGDGTKVIADLTETARGPIAQLLSRGRAEKMLREHDADSRNSLQRYAYLTIASEQLEPGSVQPGSGRTYRRVMGKPIPAPKPPPPPPPPPSRLRWIKRSPVGRALRKVVRNLRG